MRRERSRRKGRRRRRSPSRSNGLEGQRPRLHDGGSPRFDPPEEVLDRKALRPALSRKLFEKQRVHSLPQPAPEDRRGQARRQAGLHRAVKRQQRSFGFLLALFDRFLEARDTFVVRRSIERGNAADELEENRGEREK